MSPLPSFIPVSIPSLGEREILYVTDALQAGEISGNSGRYLDRFENEFAYYCGCQYGIATSSGTTALHLAMASLGIGPGDEVLVSTLTNMATFFAVLYQGATAVPVDVEDDTGNLNPVLLERLVTPRTKAILVVHLYGHPADMDAILEVAKRHRLRVIEDVAEAHGALYKGLKVGSLGDIGCFSFYANKIITTGEGGMLTTNDPDIAKLSRALRSLAFGAKHKFMHTDIGFNYRMTNLQAALGCAQLERIEEVIESKRRVAHLYGNELSDLDDLGLPIEKPYARNVYWMYHIVVRNLSSVRRDLVIQLMSERGIETRPAFIPFNMQQIFVRKGMTHPELCPVANRFANTGFYLPSSPTLSQKEVNHISSQLKDVLNLVRERPAKYVTNSLY